MILGKKQFKEVRREYQLTQGDPGKDVGDEGSLSSIDS
jgi:DNA-binding XRE family transcriptional regulator